MALDDSDVDDSDDDDDADADNDGVADETANGDCRSECDGPRGAGGADVVLATEPDDGAAVEADDT